MRKSKKAERKDNNTWLLGLILVAVAIVSFFELQFVSGLFLLILGVGFMAYENPKFRAELYHLFLKILKNILERIKLLREET
jgi:hypothetical protein